MYLISREYKDQQGDLDWPEERYIHLLKLKQQAFDKAVKKWADYLFVSFIIFKLNYYHYDLIYYYFINYQNSDSCV